MRLKFQKAAAILLSVFLVVSTAGNVFGCTECVGGERSQRVNTAAGNGCCIEDQILSHDDSRDVPAIHQLGDQQHGSCPDCTTQQGSAFFSKRAKRIPTAATISTISNGFPQTAVSSVKRVVDKPAPQPPTKTSQTLLAHRTVVLLN